MQASGRTTGGRLALGFGLMAVFAGAALAAEVWTAEVPQADAYVVNAVLVPGFAGAEVLADDKGQGHVDFRIGFGENLRLSVNGADAGPFEPGATYAVTVDCYSVGLQWFASTEVVNQSTGAVLYTQMDYPMPGAATEVRATGEDVLALSVQ